MTDIASLVMKVDASQIDAGAKSLDKLAAASIKTEHAAELAASSLKKLGVIAASAFAVWNVSGMIKDAVLLAARYETLGISLYTAGRNAGYASHQMDEYQRALEKTGISMIESRNTLIQMSAANMDLANATKLARAAQDLAVVGNVNSSESFNRLVYGIKSGQTDVLRTLGLNVQFEQSYKTLAAQLGKNVNALTEQERMQARTNIVMEASAQYAGIYEGAMTTAAKQLSSLDRYHKNLQVVMGSTFTEALAMAVAAYTGGLKDLNAEAQDLKIKGDLKEWGRITALTLAVVADSARMAANAVIIAGASLAKLGLYAKIANKPWADSVAADKATLADLTDMQANAMAGMADNLKIYDAVTAGFEKSDEEDAQRKQKKLDTDAKFAAQALAIMETYANDAVTMRKKLTGLADVFGGDYAAQYGTRKATTAPIGESTADASARKKKHEDELRDIRQSALEAQKIYADIDPTYNATLAWERYMELVKGGYLDLKTAGKAYAEQFGKDDAKAQADANEKAAKDLADSHEKAAKEASKYWDQFTQNFQRNVGDVLYDQLNGKFTDIGELFKQMLFRMAADAAAANLTQSLFGGMSGFGGIGALLGLNGGMVDPVTGINEVGMGVQFVGEGGGFTGYGPRAGGLDGKGGFLSVLHPNETVTDHTKGQSTGSNVVYLTYAPVNNIDARSDIAQVQQIAEATNRRGSAELVDRLQRQGAL